MNFSKKNIIIVSFLFIFSVFLLANSVFAVVWDDYLNIIGQHGFEEANVGAPELSVMDIIVRIVNVVLSFLGILFLTLIIYGGHMWMFAGGNENRLGKAKKILTNSIIGVAIVLLSWSISYVIFKALGAA